jgi:hypothetical protein
MRGGVVAAVVMPVLVKLSGRAAGVESMCDGVTVRFVWLFVR